MKRFIYNSLILAFMWATSCQPTAKPVPALDRSLIEGEWELLYAERNGKATETLRDAFFNFEGDSILSTNILGEFSTQVYTWKDSLLETSESMTYKIQSLKQDSLQIWFKIQQFEFQLELAKVRENDSIPQNVPLAEE